MCKIIKGDITCYAGYIIQLAKYYLGGKEIVYLNFGVQELEGYVHGQEINGINESKFTMNIQPFDMRTPDVILHDLQERLAHRVGLTTTKLLLRLQVPKDTAKKQGNKKRSKVALNKC
jgi:hypothetical protein